MNEDKRPEVGDVFSIPEDKQKAVTELFELIADHENTLSVLSRKLRTSHKTAWDFIKKMLPEVDGFGMSYDKENHTIVLISHEGLSDELRERIKKSNPTGKDLLEMAKDQLVAEQLFDAAANVRDIYNNIGRQSE